MSMNVSLPPELEARVRQRRGMSVIVPCSILGRNSQMRNFCLSAMSTR